MSCFDMMADEGFEPRKDDWLLQAARARRRARTNADLTNLRTEFLKQHALEKTNGSGQGPARQHKCVNQPLWSAGLDTAQRSMDDALGVFPRFSARLLLRFRLLTPLLTRDDDPFYLFDNPVRKDHLLGLPCISAAALKGLSADAYQRAFPGDVPWPQRGGDDPERTRKLRIADPRALRLFGIADDGSDNNASRIGRLHFSPVWFEKIQLLVMNPGDPKTAIGTLPIQFEAIAPEQYGVLEVVYFNPYGTKDSDEPAVRGDLACWLAALAAWWPVLGLGAKRLAGYGAIGIESAELQAVAWSDMEETQSADLAAVAKAPEPPPYYDKYLEPEGMPWSEETLASRLNARLEESGARLAELDHKWRYSQGKAQSKAKKQWEKEKRKLEGLETQMRGEHRKVVEYWRAHGQTGTEEPGSVRAASERLTLHSRTEQGPESWRRLAEWMAGEKQA